MIGIILIAAASFFDEIFDSTGKKRIGEGKQSLYAFGFLSLFWSIIFFILFAAFDQSRLSISTASFFTLGIRIVLEIALAHITVVALSRCDRSTFGFMRVISGPLLLIVDLILGYEISYLAMIGMGIIFVSVTLLFSNRVLNPRGIFFAFVSAVLPVATISLYKYDITHFNSVSSEQLVVMLCVILYFYLASVLYARENPLSYLKHPFYLGQSVLVGASTLIASFAYLFAPASIITAAKRAFAVLFSIFSGNFYFKERNFLKKAGGFTSISIGFLLLVL